MQSVVAHSPVSTQKPVSSLFDFAEGGFDSLAYGYGPELVGHEVIEFGIDARLERHADNMARGGFVGFVLGE